MKYFYLLLMLTFILSCTKELSEAEYYNTAKEKYASAKVDEAIKNFEQLITHYPQGKHRAEALFMLGYIYANDVKQYKEAEVYYQKFIDENPNHDLADDAAYELKMLGKSADEFPFVKKLNSDSTAENAAQ